jgi:ABC-2 type transport system permease protein/lipopolysaccharide transport system permease protein
MITSIVVIYLRDVRNMLALVLQFGLFATPVAYPLSAIPATWRPLYCLLNPLAPIIDAYRRTTLYGQAPDWSDLGLASMGIAVMLFGGYLLFKKLEIGIADVA